MNQFFALYRYYFAAAQQTSTAKLTVFFQNFKKQCVLWGLMKLKLLQETLLLTIYLHYKVREHEKMTKGPSFQPTTRFLIWLLTVRRQMPHIFGFMDCFSFSHFLATSCQFSFVRLNSLKFWTKFWKTQINFLMSTCTSLLLGSKPVQPNWLCLFKNFKKQYTLWGLMKLILLQETLLLTIFLRYEVRENQNITKGPSFETTRGILNWLVMKLHLL